MTKHSADSDVAAALKRAYRRRLASLDNVRTAVADVTRKLENGYMEPRTARAMVYALSALAGLIKDSKQSDVPAGAGTQPSALPSDDGTSDEI